MLFRLPDDVTIEAIWRCSRGHEQPARVLIDGKSTNATDFQVEGVDGVKYSLCFVCLIEDYGCKLVEFGEG